MLFGFNILLPVFKGINYLSSQKRYRLIHGKKENPGEYRHLKHENGDRIEFPLGLLVEKWLLYYYPFIESDIPQKPRECDKGDENLFR